MGYKNDGVVFSTLDIEVMYGNQLHEPQVNASLPTKYNGCDFQRNVEAEFETAFRQASIIISSMAGYISHQLQHCVENNSRYILLVNWRSLEDHTVGFRTSQKYQEWKKLLHHFYNPFPVVEHFELIYEQKV